MLVVPLGFLASETSWPSGFLSEAEVLRIISLEPNPRNRAILLTLYGGGFRVSEICSLKWRHLQSGMRRARSRSSERATRHGPS